MNKLLFSDNYYQVQFNVYWRTTANNRIPMRSVISGMDLLAFIGLKCDVYLVSYMTKPQLLFAETKPKRTNSVPPTHGYFLRNLLMILIKPLDYRFYQITIEIDRHFGALHNSTCRLHRQNTLTVFNSYSCNEFTEDSLFRNQLVSVVHLSFFFLISVAFSQSFT